MTSVDTGIYSPVGENLRGFSFDSASEFKDGEKANFSPFQRAG